MTSNTRKAQGNIKTKPRSVDRGYVSKDSKRGLLLHDRKHITCRQHEVFVIAVRDFSAPVLGVDHNVTHGYVHRNPVPVVVNAAGAYCDDFTFLWFLLRGVRDNQA